MATASKPLPGVPGPAPIQRSNTSAGLQRSTSTRVQPIKIPIKTQITAPLNYSRPQASYTTNKNALAGPSRPPQATVKRSNTTPLSRTTPPTTSAHKGIAATHIRLPPTAAKNTTTAAYTAASKGPAPPPKGNLSRSKSESQKPLAAAAHGSRNKSETIKALKAPLPAIPQGVVAKNLVLAAEPNATVLDSGLPNVTSNHIVRVVESGGLCLKEAERAFYGRHALPSDRITWNRTADNDANVKSLLEWVERTRWGLASLGLHKFMASKTRGALVFNVHGRLSTSPDTPAVDWITFEDAQRTLDMQLQNYIGTYDPSTHVLVFVFRVSPTGDSVSLPLLSLFTFQLTVMIFLAQDMGQEDRRSGNASCDLRVGNKGSEEENQQATILHHLTVRLVYDLGDTPMLMECPVVSIGIARRRSPGPTLSHDGSGEKSPDDGPLLSQLAI